MKTLSKSIILFLLEDHTKTQPIKETLKNGIVGAPKGSSISYSSEDYKVTQYRESLIEIIKEL